MAPKFKPHFHTPKTSKSASGGPILDSKTISGCLGGAAPPNPSFRRPLAGVKSLTNHEQLRKLLIPHRAGRAGVTAHPWESQKILSKILSKFASFFETQKTPKMLPTSRPRHPKIRQNQPKIKKSEPECWKNASNCEINLRTDFYLIFSIFSSKNQYKKM